MEILTCLKNCISINSQENLVMAIYILIIFNNVFPKIIDLVRNIYNPSWTLEIFENIHIFTGFEGS